MLQGLINRKETELEKLKKDFDDAYLLTDRKEMENRQLEGGNQIKRVQEELTNFKL